MKLGEFERKLQYDWEIMCNEVILNPNARRIVESRLRGYLETQVQIGHINGWKILDLKTERRVIEELYGLCSKVVVEITPTFEAYFASDLGTPALCQYRICLEFQSHKEGCEPPKRPFNRWRAIANELEEDEVPYDSKEYQSKDGTNPSNNKPNFYVSGTLPFEG